MKLLNLMEKQQFLDSKIKSSRERTLDDIVISMIGEIIEWNEECKNTHKTWKDKPYHEENQFMEWVDVLFFLNQNINKICEDKFQIASERSLFKEKLSNKWESTWEEISKSNPFFEINNSTVKKLINVASSGSDSYCTYSAVLLIEYYIYISHYQGYTKDMIEMGYMEKLDINLGRIGCEWN